MCLQATLEVLAQILFDLTLALVKKSPSASYPPMGIGARFWRECSSSIQVYLILILLSNDLRYLILMLLLNE